MSRWPINRILRLRAPSLSISPSISPSPSSSPSPPLVLGLSASGVAWLEAGNGLHAGTPQGWAFAPWQRAPGKVPPATTPLPEIPPALMQRVRTQGRIDVCLGPSVAQHWLQTPPAHTANLAELHAVARARAAHLFGGAVLGGAAGGSTGMAGAAGGMVGAAGAAGALLTRDDADAVGLDADWDAKHPFLCTRVAPPWLEVLANLGVPPRRVTVLYPLRLLLRKLGHSLTQHGWLALCAAQTLHLVHFQHGRMDRLRSVHLPLQLQPDRHSGECNTNTNNTGASNTTERADFAAQTCQREMHLTQTTASPVYWLDAVPQLVRAPASTSGQGMLCTPTAMPMRLLPWPRHAGATVSVALPLHANTKSWGPDGLVDFEALDAAWATYQWARRT